MVVGYRDDGKTYLLWYSASGRLERQVDVSAGAAGPADGRFVGVGGIVVDAAGEVLATDAGANRVQVLGPDGAFVRRFGRNGGDGSAGSAAGEFTRPMAIADNGRGEVAVADQFRVQRFSDGGTLLGELSAPGLGGAGSLAYAGPSSLVVPAPALGRVVVMGAGGGLIGTFAAPGDLFGSGPNFGQVAAGGGSGLVWLSDPDRRVVRQQTVGGKLVKECVIGDPEQRQDLVPPAQALEPGPIAMSAAGDLVVSSQSAKGTAIWVLRGVDRSGASSCLRPRSRLRVAVRVAPVPRRARAGSGLTVRLALSRRARLRIELRRCAAPRHRCGRPLLSVRWGAPAGRSRRTLRLRKALRPGSYALTAVDADSQSPRPGRAATRFRLRS